VKRRPLVAGNWKMNLNHLEAIALVQKVAFSLSKEQFEAVEAVVLPPFVDIRSVQTLVDGDRLALKYGAQDLSPFDSGAYTGDISGPMLSKLGCSYVVIGHSERRQYHAEDDAVVARVMLQHLRHAGFEVEWVEDGQRGLTKLRYERPDVAVIDMMLPGLDGWAVTETARRERIGTPIIAVSARGSEHDKVHTLGIGADDYLAKPFGMRELVMPRSKRSVLTGPTTAAPLVTYHTGRAPPGGEPTVEPTE